LILSQFDYVFKMKLLEFYRGQGIKLWFFTNAGICFKNWKRDGI
jgi:hypothetical protein